MSRTRNTKPTIFKYHEEWAVKNGYRPEAASATPEDLHADNTNRFGKVQASSVKLQAPSVKRSQKISE